MKRGSMVAIITLLVLLTSVPGAGQQTATPLTPPSPLSDEEIRKILVERVDVEHRGVGIVVGVITPQGQRIISYGKPDGDDLPPLGGDTVFEIGSITKVFTSLLLADMVRRGEVALNDPVEKYLPAGVKVPEWKGHPIKLVDLSTQTSGLPFFPMNYPLIDDPVPSAKDLAFYSLDKLYEFLNSYELLHDVGVNWEYSNLGVGLLGIALSRRAGTDFEGLVRERITGPLGMKSTGIAVSRRLKKRLAAGHIAGQKPAPDLDFPIFFANAGLAGAGSLRSTANDMLKFLGAFLGTRKTPLAPAMAAMLETRRPGADWLAFLGGQQALGWWVIGKGNDPLIAHSGDTIGFSGSVAFDPKARFGAVALSNSVDGGTDLAMHIVRPSYALTKPGVPRAPKKEIAVDPKLFDLYVGHYQVAPNVILVIGREGDKLWFMGPGSPRVRLHAESDRDYYIASSDVGVTFQLGPEGRAKGLILHLYGQFHLPATRIGGGAGK